MIFGYTFSVNIDIIRFPVYLLLYLFPIRVSLAAIQLVFPEIEQNIRYINKVIKNITM